VSQSGFAAGKAKDSADQGSSSTFGIVTGNGVRIREDHGLEGEQVATADKGESVEILEKWTSPSDMALIREDCIAGYDDRQYNLKKGMGVHVLEHAPGSEEVIVTFTLDGETVKAGVHIEFIEIQKEQTWYRVRTEKGAEGWIFGKFIEEK